MFYVTLAQMMEHWTIKRKYSGFPPWPHLLSNFSNLPKCPISFINFPISFGTVNVHKYVLFVYLTLSKFPFFYPSFLLLPFFCKITALSFVTWKLFSLNASVQSCRKLFWILGMGKSHKYVAFCIKWLCDPLDIILESWKEFVQKAPPTDDNTMELRKKRSLGWEYLDHSALMQPEIAELNLNLQISKLRKGS